MKYLQDKILLPLILSIDKSGNINWYGDVEFAVHKYTRSHRGGIMTTGTVVAYVQSSKQKLNTNILSEANLVGVDNVLAQVIWTWYFLKEQGYEIHDNVIYQDNRNIIKPENNGRLSIIKRTRQLNTGYYFITDRITKQQEYVEFYITLDIIGD